MNAATPSWLVQVMAWCRQATSHYLSQYWPRSMLPNGITRPQWVNAIYVSLIAGELWNYLFSIPAVWIVSAIRREITWSTIYCSIGVIWYWPILPIPFRITSPLTHWGWDKIDATFQTTFSNAFSWMKIYEFWLSFHWSLSIRVQLTIFQHWFR